MEAVFGGKMSLFSPARPGRAVVLLESSYSGSSSSQAEVPEQEACSPSKGTTLMACRAPAQRLPVLYLSHGSPALGFVQNEDSAFMQRLGKQVKRLPGLKAIVIISAHWEERPIRVNTSERPDTIHDFYGFPAEYYKVRYPGKGSPALAARVLELLSASGISAQGDLDHGLDHGAWIPLKWILPAGEVPVLQVSLLRRGSMKDHIRMGQALRPLRSEGVLIIGSGSAVHNLRDMRHYYHSQGVADYVGDFDAALECAVVGVMTEKERAQRLLDLGKHPTLNMAHPTLEHLLPLHVAGGAAGDDSCSKIYHKHEMSFSSASFAFGPGLL